MSALFAFKKGAGKRAAPMNEAPATLPITAVVPPSAKRSKITDGAGAGASVVSAPVFPVVPELTGDDLPSRSLRGSVLHSGVIDFIEKVVQGHMVAATSACSRGSAADRAALESAQAVATAFLAVARQVVFARGAIPEGANPKNVDNRMRLAELKTQVAW